MSTGQIAILAFAAVGLIGALAVASVALRRGTGSETVTGSVDRRAMLATAKAPTSPIAAKARMRIWVVLIGRRRSRHARGR